MHPEQGAENRGQILLGIAHPHGLSESSEGYIEKLLHDLIADDALLRRQGVAFPVFTPALKSNE